MSYSSPELFATATLNFLMTLDENTRAAFVKHIETFVDVRIAVVMNDLLGKALPPRHGTAMTGRTRNGTNFSGHLEQQNHRAREAVLQMFGPDGDAAVNRVMKEYDESMSIDLSLNIDASSRLDLDPDLDLDLNADDDDDDDNAPLW